MWYESSISTRKYLALLHYDHARVLVSSLLCLLLTVDAFKLSLETAAPQSHTAIFLELSPCTVALKRGSTRPYRVRLRALLYLCERGLERSDQLVGAAVVVVVTIHLEKVSHTVSGDTQQIVPIFIKEEERSSS